MRMFHCCSKLRCNARFRFWPLLGLLILDPGPPLPGDEARHLPRRLRLAAQDPSQAPAVQLRNILDLSEEVLRGEGR